MQCEQFEQILEQQDDGPLPKPALAHIEACEACRALTADLDAIHDVALELGAEGIAPPERVWVSLRNQLEAEGIIHEPRPAPQAHASSSAGGPFFSAPPWRALFCRLCWSQRRLISYQSNSTQMAMHPQLALQQESSRRSLRGERIQGRIADRWQRFDSGIPKAGRRRDGFHPPEPRNC